MGATEEKEPNIAFEVLKEKHNNGKVEDIHNQIFYKLEKDSCPVCDMKAGRYFKQRRIEEEILTTVSMTNAEKLSNRMARKYNPKNRPPATVFQCYKCGKEERVGDSHVNGPQYLKLDLSERACSSCWLERFILSQLL